MAALNLKLVGGAIVVLVVILVGILLNPAHSTVQSGNQSSAQIPVLLTDPPIVPAGTTALVIDYSSVKVHVRGTASSGWVNASGSGTINLLDLVNTTEVIGTTKISANSIIDMIGFNVTSATITINGTTSNVTVPSGKVTAQITGEGKVNATSGLLLDLSPTVAAIYTANSTVFVMVPSVRAIIVGSQHNASSQIVGSRAALNASDRNDLEDVKPNISIVSSSLNVSGNSTDLSVTVKDNSNASVVLRHVLVFGNYSVVVASFVGANATVHVIEDNGSVTVHGNANESGAHNSSDNGLRVKVNATANMSTRGVGDNANVPSDVSGSSGGSNSNQSELEPELVHEGLTVQHTRMFDFLVNQSGTLILPSSSGEFEGQDFGYNLTAGHTATFTFSGKLSFGEGHITITPSGGLAYKLVVGGENGASASANVIAR